MKISALNTASNNRAILLFAGWAMDSTPFESLAIPGYDIIIAYDYTTLDFDVQSVMSYDEIIVVAWSFGVAAATRWLINHPNLPVSSTIAINGTQHPVDDNKGIPHAIFDATLSGLSEQSLLKFYRRMAGSKAVFDKFASALPKRHISSLREELKAIASRDILKVKWDVAVVSSDDRIIPPDNQINAWIDEAFSTITVNGSHLPDFQNILSTTLKDKNLVATRFGNSLDSYDENAVVQHDISARLISLWNPDSESHPDIIEIGCGTGYSTRQYLERVTPRSLKLWDFNVPALTLPGDFKQCDAETELMNTPPQSADVIFSASAIQWFNSLPAFFRNAAAVLRRNGTLAVSTFGNQNFIELALAGGPHSQNPSLSELQSMIPKELEVRCAVEDTITLTFDSPAEAMRHISLTGVNAIRRNVPASLTRSILNSYPIDSQGHTTLTYNPLYLILRKK